MNKYIPDTNITYNDFLELDNQLYKIKYEKSKLEKENKQLKDNWNKLKEWLNNFRKLSEFEQWEIVKKMQELENGDSNE